MVDDRQRLERRASARVDGGVLLREHFHSVDLRPVRRQLVAVVEHAPAGLRAARGAIGLVILRHPSGHQVPVVEPHREDVGPDDVREDAAAESDLAIVHVGEQEVGREPGDVRARRGRRRVRVAWNRPDQLRARLDVK